MLSPPRTTLKFLPQTGMERWQKATLPRVVQRCDELRRWTDSGLQDEAQQLRERASQPQRPGLCMAVMRRSPTSRLLVNATAVVFEAVRRQLGKELYPVQLYAGMSLGNGQVVRMATGEGKTITTAIPAFFQALQGRGVHVATTNAYLAERDRDELAPVFEMLGLTVGMAAEGANESEKRQAYACDITFGTGYEFGFDYLRDQIQLRDRFDRVLGEKHLRKLYGAERNSYRLLQSEHFSTIIDEADSVLVDEATMPLLLSRAAKEVSDPEPYRLAQQVADGLVMEKHYTVDEQKQTIAYTQEGWQEMHAGLAGHSTLPLSRPWSLYVENSLRARWLLHRDVHYVVLDGKVAIVDQFTGRIHPDRTWRDGLHQAIEMREAVQLTPESYSDAKITRQRFYRNYQSLSGLTGTTVGIEGELRTRYSLTTVPVPTHRPCLRESWPTRVFRDRTTRNSAIGEEVLRLHALRRPVLVGTRTIQQSNQIADVLQGLGLPATVLNGTQDADEASLVALAGRSGSVLIATNIAGRGTDIQLDRDAKMGGGLHVLAVEHNESRRIDQQLIGRAARQGDPGSFQFFITAEDELLQRSTEMKERIQSGSNDDGEFDPDISQQLANLQIELEDELQLRRERLMASDGWLDRVLETLASSKSPL